MDSVGMGWWSARRDWRRSRTTMEPLRAGRVAIARTRWQRMRIGGWNEVRRCAWGYTNLSSRTARIETSGN